MKKKMSKEEKEQRRIANLAKRLRSRLYHGIVEFSFRKANGEIRHAFGTTMSRLVNNVDFEKVNGNGYCGKDLKKVNFWDLEKSEWRSCREDAIIHIVPLKDMRNPPIA